MAETEGLVAELERRHQTANHAGLRMKANVLGEMMRIARPYEARWRQDAAALAEAQARVAELEQIVATADTILSELDAKSELLEIAQTRVAVLEAALDELTNVVTRIPSMLRKPHDKACEALAGTTPPVAAEDEGLRERVQTVADAIRGMENNKYRSTYYAELIEAAIRGGEQGAWANSLRSILHRRRTCRPNAATCCHATAILLSNILKKHKNICTLS